MKKYLILAVAAILITCKANGAINKNQFHNWLSCPWAINPGQDTAKYLKETILPHKEKFVHQQLNVLLTELNLNVKSYSYIHNSKPGQPLRGIVLFFDDDKISSEKLHRHINVPTITVYFDKEIPRNEAWTLQYKGQGAWLQGEKDYYGKLTVKDLVVSSGE
ncbi:hypothetical protein [Mucilaginibacter sp. OK098]|uniref:hypothetical protein n=1 Tax=Mucilaginibacter sp. OK098 TaxID=1855297 RepID=UPI000922B4A0|nr:hypothetical protein [Mucilaginibacter sp. OK098]SHM20393.1 hypothetical protein SAMN05216524_1011146 [Mucilaginibacter sp. OK098]